MFKTLVSLRMIMHSAIELLDEIKANSGPRICEGLKNEEIEKFIALDENLAIAIEEANERRLRIQSEFGDDFLLQAEKDLISHAQEDFVNFYSAATVNPYIALAAKGPWIVSTHGAVIHDNGGYGMLGGGHGPDDVMEAMSDNHVMANIMTANFSQKRFADALRKELGHSRPEGCPFSKFICLNSGSESVTLSMRIADANTKIMTAKGSRYEGAEIKRIALKQAFHGRTHRPATISDSCYGKYQKNLKTFETRDSLIIVPSNDVAALEEVFEDAKEKGYFIELIAVEPVQGEGAPGQIISREFYDAAVRLIHEHGGMILVDSIQAGLRGQGCLSIVDYPGFQDATVPDLETWSKAINAGQYPLSVVGLSERAANTYAPGIYGNTMTTNPRALEVAVSVLEKITPELRQNILDRGVEFVDKLNGLKDEFPDLITKVQGSGLLCSAEIDPEKLDVVGFDGVETWCRKRGLGVVHGGINALRFTPHFNLTSEEIDMIISIVRESLYALHEPAELEAVVQ